MQTTCPECRTSFRITQAHLGLRRGLVRCGQCNAVFNAYDTLLPELAEPPAEAMRQALAEPPAPELADAGGAPASQLPFEWQAVEPQPAVGDAAALSAESLSTDTPGEARDLVAALTAEAATRQEAEPMPAPAFEPTPVASVAVETSESILLAELPTRIKAARPRLPWWQATLLGGLALALLLALLFQVGYFFRADLAAAYPPARPLLDDLCRPLGCSVALPRGLTRQAITASALEHDTEQRSRVRLTFLLANRTGQTQAWPQLALTLSDVRDAPVAHTLFPPERYLPKGTEIAAGMAADSEREVRLDLDVGNLAPSGYALGLVYP